MKRFAILIAVSLMFVLVPVHPFAGPAYAETTNIDAEVSAAQQLVEASAAEYEAALERVAQLDEQIQEHTQRIAELEALLPAQQDASNTALSCLYIMGRSGTSLLDLFLSAQNVNELLRALDYLLYWEGSLLASIEETQNAQQALMNSKQALEDDRLEAQNVQQQAENALQSAIAAREAAQLAAQKKLEEEQAAREEASVDAPSDTSSPGESSDASSGESGTEITETPSNDNADWSQDKASFVSQWASRIDAYLSGSPLAGQGATFAAAAWDYGVDPRFSPAISCVESSKGLYCFRSYNAWGWGSVSWSSWEEAIDAHVRGLARGYGYTVSIEGAKKYCPPNWQHWYNRVCEEMNKI